MSQVDRILNKSIECLETYELLSTIVFSNMLTFSSFSFMPPLQVLKGLQVSGGGHLGLFCLLQVAFAWVGVLTEAFFVTLDFVDEVQVLSSYVQHLELEGAHLDLKFVHLDLELFAEFLLVVVVVGGGVAAAAAAAAAVVAAADDDAPAVPASCLLLQLRLLLLFRPRMLLLLAGAGW